MRIPTAVLLLLTVLGSTLVFLPAPAFASTQYLVPGTTDCGITIPSPGYTTVVMTGNIGPCSGNGLVLNANNFVLNCAGFTIYGSGSGFGISNPAVIPTNPPTPITGIRVENCVVTGFLYGFAFSYSYYSTFLGNTVYGNTASGFRFYSSSNNRFYSNTAYSNGAEGFVLSTSSNRNSFQFNTANGNTGSGFYLTTATVTNNAFLFNTANGNSANGFYVVSTTVTANVFYFNTANHNKGYGCLDVSKGSGTDGTANYWYANTATSASPPSICP